MVETITKYIDQIKNGTLKIDDIKSELAKKIKRLNAKLNCYLSEDSVKGNDNAQLYGIPIALKDNINIKGRPTSCASKILENYVAPYDATVIKKLKAEGASFLGKTNMDEFAMGSSTENSAFMTTKNPHDLTCVPGGSSGGSAAAVASGLAIAALGSDTGGSIRQPASFCGVVGLKPTYGRISRYGLIAFASSLDQIGPITQTVEDAALLFEIIAGYDPLDSTTSKIPTEKWSKLVSEKPGKLKIGIPDGYLNNADDDVAIAIEKAAKLFEAEGMEIRQIEFSKISKQYAVADYYIVAPAEASANLARFDGVRYGHRTNDAKDLEELYKKSRTEGFGKEVKRRIMLGTYVLSSGYYDAYYLKAQRVRNLIYNDFVKAFNDVDLIIGPVTPTTAFRIGEKTTDPISMYLSDLYTIPASLSGLPAISIPCGYDKNHLPIGLQIVGKWFDETKLLQAANLFEKSSGIHHIVPKPFKEN